MSDKFDFKKEYKDLYLPPKKPVIINVPSMKFIAVNGKGNPNTCEEYKNAMEILYGLSYSIKMSKMNGTEPEGYYDYVVPPLEGFWEMADGSSVIGNVKDKNLFVWTSLIRQPEFVTKKVFEQAKAVLSKKKPELNLDTAQFVTIKEGLCVQILHVGTYDTESASVDLMNKYIGENGYENDFSDGENGRRHHEIYLGDPRRIAPEKRRTVIRHPVKKVK
ncbi:MAG: GyrI-like domain-containing protein [Treponema sp.]